MSDDNNRSNQSFGINPASHDRNNLPWVILAVVILLIILGLALFRDRLFPSSSTNNQAATEEVKPSGYQAVFLTNGQVYFGKLTDVSATYATLTDVYYLQVAPQPNLQGSQNQQTASQQQQQQQLFLVKLGKELHGPVDEMKINREQILFYEDIKEEGTVMKKIREDQANTAKGTNNQQTQQQQTPQQQTQTPATSPTR